MDKMPISEKLFLLFAVILVSPLIMLALLAIAIAYPLHLAKSFVISIVYPKGGRS